MFDQQAKLEGFHDQKRTVKVTMTPDGSYPSFQFIEFRTEEAAKQYVSVVNGRCDKDGEIGYKAEIVNTVTIRRADNLAAELNYLKLSTDDYDDARMRLGNDVIPARPGMPGWKFKAGRNEVEQIGKNKYAVGCYNGLLYQLVPVGETRMDDIDLITYQLVHPSGEVDWEGSWDAREVPKKVLSKIGEYPLNP